MPINSRQKGAAGEREFAKLLRDNGYEARRGQQFQGSPDSPDVVAKTGPIGWEIKRVQQVTIEKWMKEAIEDAGPDGIGVVAHRRNGEEWKITMRAEVFLQRFLPAFLASLKG